MDSRISQISNASRFAPAAASATTTFVPAHSFLSFLSTRRSVSEWKSSSISLQTLHCHGFQSERRDRASIVRQCLKQKQASQHPWDWQRWQLHFSEMDELDTLMSTLKSQLEDAVNDKDFQEASRLKKIIERAAANDIIAEIMSDLKRLVKEERYWEAVQLEDNSGAALAVYLQRSEDTSRDFGQLKKSLEKNSLGSKSVAETDETFNSSENSMDQMPGFKLKTFRVIVPEGDVPDQRMLEELIQRVDEAEEGRDSDAESDIEVRIKGNFSEDNVVSSEDTLDEKQEEAPSLLIGGHFQPDIEEKMYSIPVRVPARIAFKGRDNFVFCIEGTPDKKREIKKERSPELEFPSTAAPSSLVETPDVTKALVNAGLNNPKIIKDIKEIVKFAMSQARTCDSVFDSIKFRRIDNVTSADPLAGLYIGASAFNESEIIELKHKYGNWKDDDGEDKEDTNLNFFEYVEAVKLSGDLFVPAGKVMFRAKVGKENQLLFHGYYPEELGVVARYKGQGRIAKAGFRNPQWIDGELIILDGKGSPDGPRLGFLFSKPSPHLLKLYNRLRLPE
eukprot:TRINITY_DN1446_c0_g1_i11.p1 TRINITY_DN1446_c0_g1~~TRINITY_DN1446_c0_g1_i11.p1  ORF type:complete len:562 (-),score=135.04 TRINITY_DN1446_c0_g1_i11:327-2012(-)